jgi:hypothetical protein
MSNEKKPKPTQKRKTVYLNVELIQQIEGLAKKGNRSFTGQVEYMLTNETLRHMARTPPSEMN